MSDTPIIFIFSYNRGGHLRLCVGSALRHARDYRIVIIDDASTDPDTVAFLDALPPRVECVRRTKTPHLRHGGLYGNMQTALEMAGDARFILFVQDDLQFVRDIEPTDDAEITRLCEEEPAAFVATTFLRGNRSDVPHFVLAADGASYTYDNPAVFTGRSYADVMAVSPARLRAVGWAFEEGELANAKRAAEVLGPMRYMFNPFLMNSPRPIAYRGRARSLPIRLLEALYRYGVYEFRPMGRAEVDAMRARPQDQFPIAENFLTLKSATLPKPWDFDIFESHRLVFPVYHLTTHPVRYIRYQLAKRLGRRGVDLV